MNEVLQLELIVGVVVTFTLIMIFVASAKSGNFDDQKKMMDGMLFDSPDDLRAAADKEAKQEEMRAKKAEKKDSKVHWNYSDSGTSKVEKVSSTGLGLELIELKVRQLSGTVTLAHEDGFVYRIEFYDEE